MSVKGKKHRQKEAKVLMSAVPETPIQCIGVWLTALKKCGFDDKIKIDYWFEDWKSRKHAVINGADQSILEITFANMYIRVVADRAAPSEKPFAFYRYISNKNPNRPKTEFHADQDPEKYLNREEVSEQLAEYLI